MRAAAGAEQERGKRGQESCSRQPVKRGQAAHNNVARMRKVLAVLALGWLLGLVLSPPAPAAGLAPPVADCYAHHRLTRDYTETQLRTGLATMPAYIREYSDCSDVLNRALLQKIGKLHGGDASGKGGSFLPTWLIVLLGVLVLGAAGSGAVALRNRGRNP
jgi:hypothetical protein